LHRRVVLGCCEDIVEGRRGDDTAHDTKEGSTRAVDTGV
jgi:hypothetical protein